MTKVFHEHLEERGTSWGELVDACPGTRWLLLYRVDLGAQYLSLRTRRAGRAMAGVVR